MLENFLAGTATLFGDPVTIGIFIFGVVGGMLFGAIPGVSMLTLAAILLPFTADLNPAQGVMLFAVIYCTGTYGGAITAALFLQKYVEKDTTRWAHLDIAGPVWDDKKGGATGFGAATLAKWIEGQGSE